LLPCAKLENAARRLISKDFFLIINGDALLRGGVENKLKFGVKNTQRLNLQGNLMRPHFNGSGMPSRTGACTP
jgi:hypothetical protein